jgi:hypothetical protein
MTPQRAAPDAAFQAFLDKWLQAEPEARLLRLFVPAARLPEVEPLLVLLHELESTAFDLDPRPAEAKLAWWGDELEHWRRGLARHPITRSMPPTNARATAAVLALPAAAAEWLMLEAVADLSQWQAPLLSFARAQRDALEAVTSSEDAPEAQGRSTAIGPAARALRRFARLAADPRGLLPLDVLAQAGASRAEIAAAPRGIVAGSVSRALALRIVESDNTMSAGNEVVSARDFLARDLARRLGARRGAPSPQAQLGPRLGTVFGLWRHQRRRP